MQRTRRHYDAEFKRNAVALFNEGERSACEIAEALGIKVDLLYRWRQESKELGGIAFPGNGKPALTEQQKRIKELEKKLKSVETERDILKKALAIFSNASK